MRQVPQKKTYTLVGNGRLARHFAHYFDLLGIQYSKWNRQNNLGQPIPSADIICLLISDSAIEPFISEHPELQNQRLIHASGRLVTPLAEGVHPLMSFSHELYARDVYQDIPLICESEHPEPAFPDLPNPIFAIPAKERALYHSLCVLAGNFTVLLWSKATTEMQTRWNIPETALHSYLKQITHNILSLGPNALTGPLVRGDQTTIEANLTALQGDPYRTVYSAFVHAYQTERGLR